jgi:LPS-assembly lipoprotein
MHCVSFFHRALRIAALVGLCTLAACGWRLQGTARLPEIMAVTYIDTEDRFTDFNRALRENLNSAGIRLTERRAEATAIVRIVSDQNGQRVLAVSARNTPQEFEVFYAVEYSVSTPAGQLIEPQRLELTRDYSYDEAAVLAKQREQIILREALARDLAGLVIRRLASL